MALTNNVKFLKTTSALWTGLQKDSNAFYYVDDKDLYLGGIKLSNGKDLAAAISRVAENEADIVQLQKDLGALTGGEGSGTISQMIAEAVEAEKTRAQGEEAKIEGLVTAEVTRAQGAESALDTKIGKQATDIINLRGLVDSNEEDIEQKVSDLTGTVNGHTTSIGNNAQAIADEITRATQKENELQGSISTLSEDVASLFDETEVGDDGETVIVKTGKIREVAAEETAKIVAGADEQYNTLKEISDFIINDVTGAAGLANDVSKLKTDFSNLETRMGEAESTIGTHTTDIADLKEDVANHAETLETHSGQIGDLSGLVNDAEKGNEALHTVLGQLSTTVGQNKTAEENGRAALQEQITANADAILAINHETTGILAQAKKYTDDEISALALGTASQKDVEYFEVAGAASAAQAAAKTYTDGEIAKVNTNIQTLDTALTWQTISA